MVNPIAKEEFINRLTSRNSSFVGKFIDEIDQFIKGSNTKTGLEELQDKFLRAYENVMSNPSLSSIENSGIAYSRSSVFGVKSGDVVNKGVIIFPNGKEIVDISQIKIDNEGNELTARQIYRSLVGRKIELKDGTKIEFVTKLNGKRIINEVLRKLPYYKGEKDIHEINNGINQNIVESFYNSLFEETEAQKHDHSDLGFVDFDRRVVSFLFDGDVYDLTLKVANIIDGKKIAYAKSKIELNQELTDEYKKMSKGNTTSTSNFNLQQNELNSKLSKKQDNEDNNKKYVEAIINNNLESAREILDETALKYGYNKKAYHGTPKNWDTFDPSIKVNGRNLGNGIYLTRNKSVAQNYGGPEGNYKELYYSSNNPFIVDEEFKNAEEVLDKFFPNRWQGNNRDLGLDYIQSKIDSDYGYLDLLNLIRSDRSITDHDDDQAYSISEALSAMGYDSIEGKNGEQIFVFPKIGEDQKEVSKRIKSADLVTYDDNGNAIPLNERFNDDNRDTRYSKDINFNNELSVEEMTIEKPGGKPNPTVKHYRETFASTTKEWVGNYEALRNKYDVFSKKAFEDSLVEIYLTGSLSPESRERLKQIIIKNDFEGLYQNKSLDKSVKDYEGD